MPSGEYWTVAELAALERAIAGWDGDAIRFQGQCVAHGLNRSIRVIYKRLADRRTRPASLPPEMLMLLHREVRRQGDSSHGPIHRKPEES